MRKKLPTLTSVLIISCLIATITGCGMSSKEQIIDSWACDNGLIYEFSPNGTFTIKTQKEDLQPITGAWSLREDDRISLVLTSNGQSEEQEAKLVFRDADVMEIHGGVGFSGFYGMMVFDGITPFARIKSYNSNQLLEPTETNSATQ